MARRGPAQTGLAALGLALALLAPAGRALACDTCAVPARLLAAPRPTCQLTSGTTDAACPSDFYSIDLVAGDTYVFTTCPATCPGTSANYDARLRVYDTSCVAVADIDDWCGLSPEITYTATATGRHVIEVTGVTTGVFGDYTLGWRKFCATGDCATPAGSLDPVTTSCQFLGDTLECGAKSYSVTLVQGQRYTFTLCGATCPGAFSAFDGLVELMDASGIVVASSTNACGDDGEVVYQTDPLTGGGTYCVRVTDENGTGDFALAWRVACQAPSAMSLSPLVARATQAGCSESETFTITTAGTPAFSGSWSITPVTGGSAVPPSGTLATASNTATFQSVVTGTGTFRVSVTMTNECGTQTQAFTYELQDRKAPDLTLSATAGCGLPPPLPDRAPAPEPPPVEAAAPAPEAPSLETVELPPHAADAAASKRVAMTTTPRILQDARVPGILRPPQAHAVGCATPCQFATLQADNPMYDVFLSCADGSFTARTGASHPVTLSSGAQQNVIYGGAFGSPGTSDVAWFLHELGVMYQDPTGGSACVFDPPDTPSEPGSIGIEMEWPIVTGTGLVLTLREEIVAFGTDATDSGVRLTLGATNDPSSSAATLMGVRWQIDYQNGGDDGPYFATVACDPPAVVDALTAEHELAPGEVLDFYRIQNNTGDPIFSNFTNTTEIAGFPDTGKPDRLVYGYWPSMVTDAWNHLTNEGDTSVDFDSAVHYWFGYDAANGIALAPGESFTRSVIIFTSGENVDCSGFTPGNAANASVIACEGDCVELGAVATDACGGATATLIDQTPGSPACVGNPCQATFDTPGSWEYTWDAVDDAGNVTRAVTTVEIRPASECLTGGCQPTGVAPPPSRRICEGERTRLDASSLGLSGCSGGVRYEWSDGSGVVGSGPVLDASPAATTTYTVTVRCDADPTCFTSASIAVTVDRVPIMGAARARDLATCSLGVEVSWDAAQFFNGGGVYNVFRSSASCADALAQPPVATGLTTLSWIDTDTQAGSRYFYAVQAEDDPTGTTCRPLGADHGGPSDAACTGFVIDDWGGILPEPPWAVLRVTHSGPAVTASWPDVRPLLPGEHFHLLKALDSPTGRLDRITPEGHGAMSYTDIDTSSPLQFFDLRIADDCENMSRKEYPIYPPGYDIPR